MLPNEIKYKRSTTVSFENRNTTKYRQNRNGKYIVPQNI